MDVEDKIELGEHRFFVQQKRIAAYLFICRKVASRTNSNSLKTNTFHIFLYLA